MDEWRSRYCMDSVGSSGCLWMSAAQPRSRGFRPQLTAFKKSSRCRESNLPIFVRVLAYTKSQLSWVLEQLFRFLFSLYYLWRALAAVFDQTIMGSSRLPTCQKTRILSQPQYEPRWMGGVSYSHTADRGQHSHTVKGIAQPHSWVWDTATGIRMLHSHKLRGDVQPLGEG
ncbi:hypothetical protein EDD15DRAFT_2196247 [Pisolithus albus]|nr:hypothetical protein EDD15DRAFT_2196247 [Pisolithus albus]